MGGVQARHGEADKPCRLCVGISKTHDGFLEKTWLDSSPAEWAIRYGFIDVAASADNGRHLHALAFKALAAFRARDVSPSYARAHAVL